MLTWSKKMADYAVFRLNVLLGWHIKWHPCSNLLCELGIWTNEILQRAGLPRAMPQKWKPSDRQNVLLLCAWGIWLARP